jgi:hypothetical protein
MLVLFLGCIDLDLRGLNFRRVLCLGEGGATVCKPRIWREACRDRCNQTPQEKQLRQARASYASSRPFISFCRCGVESKRVTARKPVPYAKFRSRSHDAVIRVYDETGNVIETHEHKGELKEWRPDSGSIAPLKVRPGSNQPEESAPRRRR